jgi:RNA polymerase sigma-70 factor (ECF subfamily)
MEQQELEIVLGKCKNGDRQAFAELIAEFQKTVFSVAFRLLCNEEDAKDATQETFIKVWCHLKSYDSSKKFSTWLYSIVTNSCLDKLRSFHHSRKVSDVEEQNVVGTFLSNDNAESKVINDDLAKLIQMATNELSPKQKLVFTLHYLEELDVDEIAKITTMTANQIKSNLYLARNQMQEKLKGIK